MDGKKKVELRKLNRMDLVEIIYQLQLKEKQLIEENEELKRRLDDKTIRIERSGSIAEAALALNNIFEAAQAAADQYLLEVKRGHGELEKRASEIVKEETSDLVKESTEDDIDSPLDSKGEDRDG